MQKLLKGLVWNLMEDLNTRWENSSNVKVKENSWTFPLIIQMSSFCVILLTNKQMQMKLKPFGTGNANGNIFFL